MMICHSTLTFLTFATLDFDRTDDFLSVRLWPLSKASRNVSYARLLFVGLTLANKKRFSSLSILIYSSHYLRTSLSLPILRLRWSFHRHFMTRTSGRKRTERTFLSQSPVRNFALFTARGTRDKITAKRKKRKVYT